MDNPTENAPAPTFMTLPLELRNQIYTHYISLCGPPAVFEKEWFNERDYHPMCYPDRRQMFCHTGDRRGPLNLFLTNRQVHDEVSSIFWPLFRFKFVEVEEAHRFFQKTSATLLSRIRRVAMEIHARPKPLSDTNLSESPERQEAKLAKLAPLYEDIRAKLPSLEMIGFEVTSARWFNIGYFLRDIPNFLAQMKPFRDVPNFCVKYKDHGFMMQIQHRQLLESGLVRVEESNKVRYLVKPGEDMEALQEATWKENAAQALETAYRETMPEEWRNENQAPSVVRGPPGYGALFVRPSIVDDYN